MTEIESQTQGIGTQRRKKQSTTGPNIQQKASPGI